VIAREKLSKHDPSGRRKGCGAWTVRGETEKGKLQHYRLLCKCWDCRYCGPRRVRRTKKAIIDHAIRFDLCRMLTLTLDPKKLHGEDSTRYLNRCFAKFRVQLRRRFGRSIDFIRVLEYQGNGNAHFHILLNRYIEVGWIRHAWQQVGGGCYVDIRRVQIRRVAGYLAKYLSKEMLLNAPEGARRVTTSRSIKLFVKPAGATVWELVRVPIRRLRELCEAIEVTFDEEGLLHAFAVRLVVLP
jgi:hypothetical protein